MGLLTIDSYYSRTNTSIEIQYLRTSFYRRTSSQIRSEILHLGLGEATSDINLRSVYSVLYLVYGRLLSIGSRTYADSMAGMNYSKAPPTFVKSDDYEKWKKKLNIWRKFTPLEKNKQGPALCLSLDDETADAVLSLEEAKISGDTGVEEIIKVLDSLYLKDKTQSGWEALDKFWEFKKGPKDSMADFINEFDRKYKKIQSYGSSVSDDILARCLMKAACLSLENERLIRATMSREGEITYDNMKKLLKRVYSENASTSEHQESVKVEPDLALYTSQGGYRGMYNPRTPFRPYRGVRGPSRFISESGPSRFIPRGRGNSRNLTGKNPLDQFGNVSTCAGCGSRNHWYAKCPDKEENTTLYEGQVDEYADHQYSYDDTDYEVTLFQSDYDSPNRFKSLVAESFGCAVIDCGASKTVCGKVWMDCYLESLNPEMKKGICFEPSTNCFKFGDGRKVQSSGCVNLPAVIGKTKVSILTDVVDEDIPLLLSKASLKKANSKIDFYNDSIHILGQNLRLFETKTGHYVLPIKKEIAILESINESSRIKNSSERKPTVTLISQTKMTVKDKAIKLHRQFGHPSVDKMLTLIKNAGNVEEDLGDAIKQVTKDCKVCKEFKKAPPRPVVGLPMATRFGECVAMDLKKFGNCHLLHVIDHATRLSACAVIRNKQPETIIKELFRIWISIYGCPEKFLSDNGGEFANEKFKELCEKTNVVVHTTAAESPWSNGLCERHNLVIADMITKTMKDTGCSVELAVHWSVNAKNSLYNVHGFSPYQLVFGRNPNFPNILTDKLPALYGEVSSDIIRDNLNALHKARELFVRSESSERIRRALRHNVRTTSDVKYVTGDRVYFKRLNEKCWKGPAVVLGQDGQQILVKHGSTYVRVHPCRLCLEDKSRLSSRQMPEVKVPTDDQSKSEDKQSNVNDFTDSESEDEASNHGEDTSAEIEASADTGESTQSSVASDGSRIDELTANTAEDNVTINSNRVRNVESTVANQTSHRLETSVQPKKNMVVRFKVPDKDDWSEGKLVSRSGKAGGKYKNSWNIQLENETKSIDFDRDVTEWKERPINEEQSTNVTNDVQYVCESSSLAEKFSDDWEEDSPHEIHYSEILNVDTMQAKVKEIDSWRKNRVYEEVDDVGQSCVSVRWVVTPKVINGENSVKARLVARGFEENGDFRKDSPTCMRESIRLVLGIIASMKWKLHSIDYKTAFLQGNEIDREVHLKPPSEFRVKGKVWKLRKTVYGLADAPRAWFLTLQSEIFKLGAKSSTFDKGVFFWYSAIGLEGIMASFVDDQLWGGTETFERDVVQKLRKTFDISCENEIAFKYIGIEMVQGNDFSISIAQKKYIASITTVEMDVCRRKEKTEELTPTEKKQFRALVGQLNWIAGISRPDVSFVVCQLSTVFNKATVQDMLRAMKVLKYLKGSELAVKIPSMGDLKRLEIWSYSDSSYANLPNGGSQGGVIIFMVNPSNMCCFPVFWKSVKLKRVVKSTLAAETLAFVEACDTAFVIGKQFDEILCRTNRPDRPIQGFTDNKSLYDSAHTVKVISDVRLRVEMQIVREMIDRKELDMHWVNTEIQLADCLTKYGASSHKLINNLTSGRISNF